MEEMSDKVFNLYGNRKELFSNKKFMLEIIKIDPRYIIYDNSNSDEVYLEFTKLMSNYISANGNDIEYSNYYIKLLDKVADEIKNPKEGTNDLYKIPHEFLYEEIRNSILLGLINNNMYMDKFSVYFELDLKYSKEYGMLLEELYRDTSAALYFAGANSHDEIFREGYQINYGGWIDRNLWNAHAVDSGFLDLLYPGKYGRDETIFARIPVEDKMILGSNGDVARFGKDGESSYTERTYLLPKYIIGSAKMICGKAVFIKNDVPINERVQYKNVGEALRTESNYEDTLHEFDKKNHSY